MIRPTILMLLALVFTAPAQADNICTGKIVPIGAVGGVLYKPVNVHGGRGPSFIVKKSSQRTYKKVIEIRNARCEVVAGFGLFATDSTYGSRYYMRSGGSGQSAEELLAIANLVGSNNLLVEGVNGTWIRIKNPLNREGAL